MPQYTKRPQTGRFSNSRSGSRTHSGQRSYGGNSRSRGGNKKRGDYISVEKFINKDVIENQQIEYVSTHKFADFGLEPQIVKNLHAKGYDTPTAIQDQAIPHVLENRDVLGLANTGTGKTAAFVLPIIHKAKLANKRNHTLIITPTRELAEQVEAEFVSFSKGMGLYSVVCVGGMNMGNQIREIKRGVHVIIGTPGRLKDLIERQLLDVSHVETLILDEADQMLDMGFMPDMQRIIGYTPKERQVLCFSATMDSRIASLINDMQRDPVQISVLQKQTSKHIYQDIIKSDDKEHKFQKLVELVRDEGFEKILVFGETKYGVQRISENLNKLGMKSDAIHGNKNQSQRRRALDAFKKDAVTILVATDVAARGLDIPKVDLVVNFDQPNTHDTYIHRIGRTGRAGKSGHARTFI